MAGTGQTHCQWSIFPSHHLQAFLPSFSLSLKAHFRSLPIYQLLPHHPQSMSKVWRFQGSNGNCGKSCMEFPMIIIPSYHDDNIQMTCSCNCKLTFTASNCSADGVVVFMYRQVCQVTCIYLPDIPSELISQNSTILVYCFYNEPNLIILQNAGNS